MPIPRTSGHSGALYAARTHCGAELRDVRAIWDLLQAMAVRKIHASPEEAKRILAWTSAVRTRLGERDPIDSRLELPVELKRLHPQSFTGLHSPANE